MSDILLNGASQVKLNSITTAGYLNNTYTVIPLA